MGKSKGNSRSISMSMRIQYGVENLQKEKQKSVKKKKECPNRKVLTTASTSTPRTNYLLFCPFKIHSLHKTWSTRSHVILASITSSDRATVCIPRYPFL